MGMIGPKGDAFIEASPDAILKLLKPLLDQNPGNEERMKCPTLLSLISSQVISVM